MPRVLVAACAIGHFLAALLYIAVLCTVEMDVSGVRQAVSVTLLSLFTAACLVARLEEK